MAVWALLAASATVLSPTAAQAWDGDNGSLLFDHLDRSQSRQIQIHQVDPDGRHRRIAFSASDEENRHPKWSPDGRWVAFSRNGWQLVARGDGSEARVVSQEYVGDLSWSPDGTRFLYLFDDERDDSTVMEIGIMNADGTDRHAIYHGSGLDQARWSPRGDLIVFSQRDPDPAQNGDEEIFTIDPQGGNLRQLTSNYDPTLRRSRDARPVWSPDGSRIAFLSDRDASAAACAGHNCYLDIHLMNPDGTQVRRLPHKYNESQMAWSPDGRKLAFFTTPETFPVDSTYLDVMDVRTGRTRHLTRGEDYSAISWGAVPGSMPTADLMTSLSSSHAMRRTDGTFSYTATVTNLGSSPSQRSEVELVLPPGAAYDAGPSSCLGEVRVRCELGVIAPGASRVVTVTASAGDAGVHEVSALGSSITADINPFDNRAVLHVASCTVLGPLLPGPMAGALTGTPGDDVLCGGSGDDQIVGGDGDDTLVGGPGSDRLDGGAGDDVVSFAPSASAVTVDLASGTASGEGSDVLVSAEQVTGSRFDDELRGSAASDILAGGPGRDLLDGRAGDDRLLGGAGGDTFRPGQGNDIVDGGLDVDLVDYRAAPGRLRVDLKRRTARGEGSDSLISVEDLTGSRFADELTGSLVGNLIRGGGGRDRIVGLGGNDRVFGDAGRDLLIGSDGDDRMSGGAGLDSCRQLAGHGRRSSCERGARSG